MLSAEKIQSNFETFRSFCEKTEDRSAAVLHMVDTLADKLATCPASGRKDFHLAIPGGLVDHSLRVLNTAVKLTKSFGWNIPKDSLVISCLFHDIGKVGTYNEKGEFFDYYVPQTSDWHRDKLGEYFVISDKIPFMTTRQRSLFLMQHFGIKLSHEEYLAILLNDGYVLDENKQYCLKEPLLAHVVMTADYIATNQEKGKF